MIDSYKKTNKPTNMKTLENKTTTIKDPSDQYVDYAFLLDAVLKIQPAGGYSLDDMKKRIKIQNVLETSDETIPLEDADAEYMKPLVRNMKWNMVHADLITFSDDVEKEL